MENFPESQKPVEIDDLRLQTDSEAGGYPRVHPAAGRLLPGRCERGKAIPRDATAQVLEGLPVSRARG